MRKLPNDHLLPVSELDVFIIPQLNDCMGTIGPLSPAKGLRFAPIHKLTSVVVLLFFLTGHFNWPYQSEVFHSSEYN